MTELNNMDNFFFKLPAKKPDTKSNILYNSIYTKCPE